MFTNFNQYHAFHAQRRGDAMMLQDDSQTLTFAQAWDYVGTIAGAMQRQGIRKGQRVGILAKNSVDNLCVFLASARLGAIAVGLNYRLSEGELEYIADDAQLVALFLDAEFDSLCGPVMQALPRIYLAPTAGQDDLKNWCKGANTAAEVDIAGDDILFHMYTSGTTGRPKGVLISHSNVLLNSYQASMSTGVWPAENDKALVIAPTFHAVGLVGAMLGVIYGSAMVIHRDYDPVGMIETLASEKITTVAVIPVMLQFSLAMVENIERYDFSALKTINYGGSPISESLLKDCMRIFGCDFVQGYGQTEATMGLTFLTADDHRRALAGEPGLLRSCGRAVFATALKVVDTGGRECAPGEVGEILAKGPQIMQGYWQRPEATADTIVDGWLHTGDAGIIDERGYVFIQDRVKDMIISGGENIYPAEIENLLMSHPEISDVAIIGVPDSRWGEVPLAVVVSAPECEITLAEMKTFCEGKLAAFKVPKHICFVPGLPRNPSGKILKKELREMFAEQYRLDNSEMA
ncbi:class I adenylate-forming enzyme family protein [Spongiibacter marinus]|uniref:class I adenylate-forming enzyme family protein n=1 Tax=Spongiibacter marinus TaxID=354246 RepID=UPI003C36222B